MKHKFTGIIFSLPALAVISLCTIYLSGPTFAYIIALITLPFVNESPEEVFQTFVLGYDLKMPSTITLIKGLEPSHMDPLKGPVYVRFKTDNTFIAEMLETDYQYYNTYSEIPCEHFFKTVQKFSYIQTYPEKFDWWQPSDVVSPICYRSGRKTPFYDDEARYLLINSEISEVYFFRTVTPLTSFD